MQNKEKIAISISADVLQKLDAKVDRVKYKNRSHVIEDFVRKGLELKDDIGAVIVANENRWEGGEYPLNYSKNLIEVDGKTLIEKHIMHLLQAKIQKIVIAVSDATKDVKKYIEKKNYTADIIFLEVEEGADSGIILEKAVKILQTQKLICLLGDNYFYNLDYTDLIFYHNSSKNKLTIVVKPESDSREFGNIQLQGNKIISFKEKPHSREDGTNIINTGLYVLNSDILPELGKNYKLEYDFFPQYIQKYSAKAYFHNGAWFHVQSDEVLKLIN